MKWANIAAILIVGAFLAPAASFAQADQKIVLTCTYQNGTEDWIIDLAAKTAAWTNQYGTSHGVVTQTTDENVVMVFGTTEYHTTYSLDRYTLGLRRQQFPSSLGEEPPVPCTLRQKQF